MKRKQKRIFLPPFCWYCKRFFPDELALVNHQRDVHFRCQSETCKKRFNNTNALVGHMQEFHSTTIEALPGALKDRASTALPVDICGMDGVPIESIREMALLFRAAHPNRRLVVPRSLYLLANRRRESLVDEAQMIVMINEQQRMNTLPPREPRRHRPADEARNSIK